MDRKRDNDNFDDDDDDDEDDRLPNSARKESPKSSAKRRDNEDDDNDDDELPPNSPQKLTEKKTPIIKRRDDDDDDDDDNEDDIPKISVSKKSPKSIDKERRETLTKRRNDDDDDDEDQIPQKPISNKIPRPAEKEPRETLAKLRDKADDVDDEERQKDSHRRYKDDEDDSDDDDNKNKNLKIPKVDNTKQCQTDITLNPEGFPPNMETDIQTVVTIGTKECSDSKIKEKLRETYVHEEIFRKLDKERKMIEEDEEEWEEEERKLIPPSIIVKDQVSATSDEITKFNEPEFRSVMKVKAENIVYVTDPDIQRRINLCETYNEKQLLNGVLETMKSFMMGINNLKQLYENVCKEQDVNGNLNDTIRNENLDDTIEQISELDKYEYDLLTHVADEFPLAVVITNSAVLESDDDDLKFDLPARNIKDFDNLCINSQEFVTCRPMMDTDLLEPPVPLDRNIFTVGSKIPGEVDPLAVKPMWDSNLKSGIIPPQVGLTKRRDRTIFLEDYIQYIMEDKDLLVQPCGDDKPQDKIKTELQPNELKYKLQYDTDLGRPPPRLRKDIQEKLAKCKCRSGQEMGECICGCPENRNICEMNSMMRDDDDNLSAVSVESDVTFPRGMFDYDLYGKFIRKTKKQPVDNVMWDYNLCPSSSRYHLANRIERRNSTDSFENTFNKNQMQRGMFDFDLIDKTEIDPKVYLDKRAMFDFDLGKASDDSSTHDSESDSLPMMDYNLKSDVIKKQFGQMSPLNIKRVYKGKRGMFDIDLKKYTATDSRLSFSEESSDSIPQLMTECDIGKNFVPTRKKEGRKLSIQKKVESSSEEDGYTHSNNAMPIPWNQVAIKEKGSKRRSVPRSTRQELTEQSNTTDKDTTDNDEYSSLPPSSAGEEDSDIEYHEDSNVNNEFVDALSPNNEDSSKENSIKSVTDNQDSIVSDSERTDVLGVERELSCDDDSLYAYIRSEGINKNEVNQTPPSNNTSSEQTNKDSIQYQKTTAEDERDMEIRNTSNMQPQSLAREDSSKRESVDDSLSRRSLIKTQQIKKSPRTSKDSGGLDTQLVAQDVSSKVENEDASSSRRPSTKNQPIKKSPRSSKDSAGIGQNLAQDLSNKRESEDASYSRRPSSKTQQVQTSPKSSKNSDGIEPKWVAQDVLSKRESEDASTSRTSSNQNQSNKKSPRTSKNSNGEDPKLLVQDISSSRENVESPRRISSKDQQELYTNGENEAPLSDEEKEILKPSDQLDSHICKAIQDSENENINSTISSPIICTKNSIKTLTTEQRNLCECEKPLTAVQTSVTNVNNENVSPGINLPKTKEERSLCECEKQPINKSMTVKQIDSEDKWLGIYTVPCAANKPILPPEILAETTKQQDSLSICECAEIKVVKPPDRNACKACVYATQIQPSKSDDISEISDEKADEMIFGKVSPYIPRVEAVAKKSSDCKCKPEQSTNSYLQPLLKIILPYTDGSKKKNILEVSIRQTDIEYKISNTSSEQTSTSNKRQTGGENKNNTRTNTNDWSSEIVQIPHNSEGNHPERNPPEEQSFETELNECSDGWSVTACREHFGEPISNNTVAFILQQDQFDCKRLSQDDKIAKYIQQIEKIISKYTDLSGLKFNDIYDKEKMRKMFRQWLNGDGSSSNNSNDSSLIQSSSKIPSECKQFIKDSKTRSEIVAMLDYEVLSDILNNNDSFINYKNELRQSEYFSSKDNSGIIENPNKCAKCCNAINISESRKGLLDSTNILNDILECSNASKSTANIEQSRIDQLDCTNIANPSNDVCECSNASKSTANTEQSKRDQLDYTNNTNLSNEVCECSNASKSTANTVEQSRIDQLYSTNNANPSNDVCECCLKSISVSESKTNVSNSKVNSTVCNANTWNNLECNAEIECKANNPQLKINDSKHQTKSINIKSSRNICSTHKSSSCNEPLPCTRISEATIPSINLIKENEFDCQNQCVITTQSNTEIISNLSSSPTILGPNLSFTDTINDKSNFKIPWDSDDYSHFELDCGEEIPGKISSATILSQPIDSIEEKTNGSELKIQWGSDYSHFSKDKECEPVQIISKQSEELLKVDSVKKIEGDRWEPSIYKIAFSGTRLIISPSCPTLSFTNSSVYGSFNYPFKQTWSEDYSHSTEEADCISVPKAQKSEQLINFEYIKKEKQVCPTEVPSYHMIGARGINLKGKCSKSEVELINTCPSMSALKLFYSCSSIPYDTDWNFKILSSQKSGIKSEYQSCEKFDQLIRGKSSTDYYSLENSYDYLLTTPHDSGCKCNFCKLKDLSATRSTDPPTCLCGFCKLSDCKCATVKVKSRTNSDQVICKCEICKCEIMDIPSTSKESRQSCKTGVSTLVEKEVMIQQLETCSKHVYKIRAPCEYKVCQCEFACINKMKDLNVTTKPQQVTEFETCKLDNCDFEIKKQQSLKTWDKLLIDQQTCKCTACQCKTIILRFESKSQQTSKYGIPKLNNWTDVNLPLCTKSDMILHLVSKSQQTSKCSCQILKQQSRTKSVHSSTYRQTGNIRSTTKSNDIRFQQNCKCGVCHLVDCKCEIINKKPRTKSATDRQINNLSSAIKSTNNLVNQTTCSCGFCNLVKCKCETIYQQPFSKINDKRNCKCKICQLLDCKCENTNQKSETVLIGQKCGFCNFLLEECKCETVQLTPTRSKDNQNQNCKCRFCNDADCKCETAGLHTITRLKDDQNQVYKCEFCNDNDCKCENVKRHSPTSSKDNQNKNYKCEFCDNVNCKCDTEKLLYTTKESVQSGTKSYSIKSDEQVCTCIDCLCETLPSRTPLKTNDKSFSSASREQVCTCNICKCEINNLRSSKTKITEIKSTLIPHAATKSNNKSLEDSEVCTCSICQCDNLIPQPTTTSNDKSLLEDTVCTCSVCQCEIINLSSSSKSKDKTNPQYRLKSGKSDRQICTCKVYQAEMEIPRSTKISNENLFSPLLVPQECTCGSCQCKKINSQSLGMKFKDIKSLSDDRAEQSCKCGVCKLVDCQCEISKLRSETRSNDSQVCQQTCTCEFCKLVDCKCETKSKLRIEIRSNESPVTQQNVRCDFCNLVDCACETTKFSSTIKSNGAPVCEICKLVNCKCETAKLRSEARSNDGAVYRQTCTCDSCKLVDCKCEDVKLWPETKSNDYKFDTAKVCPTIKSNNNLVYQQISICADCKSIDCKCGNTDLQLSIKSNVTSLYRQSCKCGFCQLVDCKCEIGNLHIIATPSSESIICCDVINPNLSTEKGDSKIKMPSKFPINTSVHKPLKCTALDSKARKSKTINDCLFTNLCPARISSKPDLTIKQRNSLPKICPANIFSRKYTEQCKQLNEVSIQFQRKKSFGKCVTESESVLQISNYPSTHSRRSVKITKHGIKSTRSSRSKRGKKSKRGKRQKSHESRKSSEHNLSSTTTSTASQTERKILRENVVTKAMISYENEIRPLKEALYSLQTKIKNLNFIDIGNLSPASVLSSPKYSPISTSRLPNLYQSPIRPIRECYCPENPFELQNFNYFTNLEHDRAITSRNMPVRCVNKTCDYFATKPLQKNAAGTSTGVNNSLTLKRATKTNKHSPTRRKMQMKTEAIPSSNMQSLSQNLPNLKIEPANFILGSTPLKTDPDMIFSWKKSPDRSDK